MCQPTSKDHVHLLWDSWGSWPKHREAGCAAQKDLCSCKHCIALYIPSLLHVYMSWLKTKSFFCKDVGFWSEFTYLVEKNSESADADVQLSPCLVDDSHMWASVQRTAKSSERFTPVEHKRPFSFSTYFYLPVLLPWPCHSTPLSCRFWSDEHQHHHMASDGIAWPRMGPVRRKDATLFWPKSELRQLTASPEAIRTPNAD